MDAYEVEELQDENRKLKAKVAILKSTIEELEDSLRDREDELEWYKIRYD